MSLNFIKLTEEALTGGDVRKVVRDFAIAFKHNGFFKDPDWSNWLINTFKDVQESDDDIDNIHEISNSFAEETSKFVKKNKNSIENEVKLDVTEGLFGDSNDSFEIPETQADPPKNHIDDELSSEGFVAIPDEEIPTKDDGSQSPVLLCDVSLFGSQQINVTNGGGIEDEVLPKINSKGVDEGVGLKYDLDFEDDEDLDLSDTIDFEMSKLNWEETTKEDDKSASVTPDLDFDLLSSTKADINDLKPITPNADSRLQDKDVSADSGEEVVENNAEGIETTTKISVEANNADPNEPEHHIVPIEETQLFTKPSLPAPISMEVETMEATQLFAKPKSPGSSTKKIEPIIEQTDLVDQDFEETQLFVKPDDQSGDDDVFGEICARKSKKKNRIFSSSDDENEEQNIAKANNRSDGEASHETNDVYDIATQKIDVQKPESRDQNITSMSDEENSDPNLVKASDCNGGTSHEVDEIYEAATQKIVVQKSRKRSHVISTSDEEGSDEKVVKLNGGNMDEVDNMFDVATQQFEKPHLQKRKIVVASSDNEDADDNLLSPMTVKPPIKYHQPPQQRNSKSINEEEENKSKEIIAESKSLKSEKFDFLKELKGSDWSKITDEINDKQSHVKFISYFDQYKDQRIVPKRASTVPSPIVAKDVADRKKENQNENSTVASGSTRRSARSKVDNSKPMVTENSVEGETMLTGNIEGRQDIEPMIESSSSTSSSSSALQNSETMPDFEGFSANDIIGYNRNDDRETTGSLKKQDEKGSKAKKSRVTAPKTGSSNSKTSMLPKPDIVNDDIEKDVQETQLFVKTTSAAKEDSKVKKILPKRQAKANLSSLSELRENKSVTYSPVPQVSSDRNENINKKSINGDDDTSNDPVSNRSRKRKSSEVLPSSNSNLSLPSSFNRTSRKQHFRVLFTMIDAVPYKPVLKQLNISLVKADEPYDVLITDKIYRSTKFMCALSSGKPIVSTSWLEALRKKETMLDPFDFILNDKEGEAKYSFSLVKTLGEVIKSGGLFQRHSILVTPSTSPSPEILKDIITSGGGKYLKTSLVPRKDDTVIAISDKADEKLLPQLKKKYPNLKNVISVEDFMQAVFQYNINVKKV